MKGARETRTKKSSPPPAPKTPGVWRSDFWIYLLLLLAILAVYGQVRSYQFAGYDDPQYVTGNPQVRDGLSWGGVAWAFTTFYGANWFPLTWLSHMLDCELFGLDSGWQHLTNVWIHALSTLLLFRVLKRMTGARWRSAAVAFLFAIHPLHVESVAWIAERKDVLSTLFWVLTMAAYAGYAAKPGRVRYAITFLVFCLGLMAKPMLVTLPIALMLLDHWPLKRGLRILEKLPFFAAAIAASVVTYVAHEQGGGIASFELVPLAVRFENALVSYLIYIFKMFWPTNLAMFYPFPAGSLVVPAVLAGVVLAGITAPVMIALPRRPYLAVGWLWYVITLVPVIGLVQAGAQSRADRYTYIPMIGLALALVWGVTEVLEPWPRIRAALAAAAASACLILTFIQVRYWRDDVALYQHAIDVTTDNYVAHFNLASALETRGKPADALAQLRETIRIRPLFVAAHAELGQLLAQQGDAREALQELQTAVRLRPDNIDAHFRLGSVLGTLGRNDDAMAEFSQVIRLQPDNADAHYNLGIALAQAGKLQEAAGEFRATARLRPDDAMARFNLGIALARLGQMDEAVAQFSEAVRIKPDFREARQALDDALSLRRRDGKK